MADNQPQFAAFPKLTDRLRRLAALALVPVWLFTAAPAQALDPEQRAEIDNFVAGNVVFTLFHELGHALIDMLQLPTLGREEDAADNLAAILMIGEPGAAQTDELVFAAADGWAMLHESSQTSGEPAPFWDSHSLDIQRYHIMLCLMYGSDPNGFADVIEAADLPDERREGCAEEYEKTVASWTDVLEPHMKRFGDGARGKIKVAWDVPNSTQNTKARARVKAMALDRILSGVVSGNVALPANLVLRFANCGEPNAFYDPEKREIAMCYELVTSFAEMIEADIRRQ